jgi:hypothetical protein
MALAGLVQAGRRDDDRVCRRVHAGPDDIFTLFGKFLIVRAFERAEAMRLEPMLLKEALHGPQRNPRGLGHGAADPMGCCAGRLRAGQLQNSGYDPLRERGASRFAGFVAQKAVDPFSA